MTANSAPKIKRVMAVAAKDERKRKRPLRVSNSGFITTANNSAITKGRTNAAACTARIYNNV